MADLTPEELKAMGFTVPGEEPKPADLTPDELKAMGMDGPPPMPPATKGADPDRLQAAWHTLLGGLYKQGSDEVAGLVTQVKAPVGGAGLRLPDGSVRFMATPNDAYRAGRDGERQILKAAGEKYPYQTFLTNVAGDVLSDAALRTTGIPVLSQGYQTAMGGIQGLLGSDAELTSDKRTSGDVAQAGIETGIGAGLGYSVPKVANAAGRVVGPLLRKARAGFESGAVGLARRVLQGGSDLAGARFKEVPADAILEALRSGAIVPLGTTEGAFKRLEKAAAERGAGYAALLQDLEDMGFKGPEVKALADELSARATEVARGTITSSAPGNVFRTAARKVEELGKAPRRWSSKKLDTLPLAQAEAIKRTAQSEAKYGLLSDTPVNEAKQEVASKVRQAIEDAIETQGKEFPEDSVERLQAESFKPVKDRLARTLAARNLAEKGNTRLSGRNAVGLREAVMGSMLSGGGMAAGGDPLQSLVGGMGTAAALSLASRRLPSTGASMLYGTSRLAKAGADGAARNPTAAGLPVAKGAAKLTREQLMALADYLSGKKEKKR